MKEFTLHLMKNSLSFWLLFLFMFTLAACRLTLFSRSVIRPRPDTGSFSLKIEPGAVLAVLLMAIPCAYILLTNTDVTFYHSDIFYGTINPEMKQYYPLSISPRTGRFHLNNQEYQFLALINESLLFYDLCRLVLLILTLLFLSLILRKYGFTWFLAMILCIFTSIPGAQNLCWIVAAERNIIFLTVLMLVGLEAYRANGRNWAIILAVASAGLLLFFKEIGVVITAAVSFVAVMQWLGDRSDDDNRRTLVIGVGLGIVSLMWLVLYFTAIFPYIKVAYHTSRTASVSRLNLLITGFREPWVWAMAAAFIARCFLFKREKLNAALDGLFLASVMYTAAIIVLGFSVSSYYTGPSAWLAYIYVWRVFSLYPKMPRNTALAVISIVCLAAQSGAFFKYVTRFKEEVAAKSQALNYIAENSGSEINLHISTNYDVFGASTLAGILIHRNAKSVFLSIDANENQLELSACYYIAAPGLTCHANQPLKTGELVLIINNDPPIVPPGELVFMSKPIGFWKNSYKTYVYKVK